MAEPCVPTVVFPVIFDPAVIFDPDVIFDPAGLAIISCTLFSNCWHALSHFFFGVISAANAWDIIPRIVGADIITNETAAIIIADLRLIIVNQYWGEVYKHRSSPIIHCSKVL
jgi:hypothetical protein